MKNIDRSVKYSKKEDGKIVVTMTEVKEISNEDEAREMLSRKCQDILHCKNQLNNIQNALNALTQEKQELERLLGIDPTVI